MERPGVRTLERGLSLLEGLSIRGWSTSTELARHVDVDRVTVRRLLATLVEQKFVMRREPDGRYFLSAKLASLGASVRDEDLRSPMISQALARLVREIHWPSDFARISSGRLMIEDSNCAHTTLTLFRSVLGQTRPILRSALGRAMLAWMPADQLEETLAQVACVGGNDAADLIHRKNVEDMIAATRSRGYAVSRGEAAKDIGAIALPVMRGDRVVGAVNVVMFIARFDPVASAAAYLQPLQRCVEEIEEIDFDRPELASVELE